MLALGAFVLLTTGSAAKPPPKIEQPKSPRIGLWHFREFTNGGKKERGHGTFRVERSGGTLSVSEVEGYIDPAGCAEGGTPGPFEFSNSFPITKTVYHVFRGPDYAVYQVGRGSPPHERPLAATATRGEGSVSGALSLPFDPKRPNRTLGGGVQLEGAFHRAAGGKQYIGECGVNFFGNAHFVGP